MGKKKAKNDVLTAFRKANRELQFERNGGGQFVATDRPWKNKKKYDRKRDRKIDSDGLFWFNMIIHKIIRMKSLANMPHHMNEHKWLHYRKTYR